MAFKPIPKSDEELFQQTANDLFEGSAIQGWTLEMFLENQEEDWTDELFEYFYANLIEMQPSEDNSEQAQEEAEYVANAKRIELENDETKLREFCLTKATMMFDIDELRDADGQNQLDNYADYKYEQSKYD